MSRRRRSEKRAVIPDHRYGHATLARFINKLMIKGKKSTAQRIMYQALGIVDGNAGREAIEVFEQALRNATPALEVKPRRVGGATYQVPIEVRTDRRLTLSIRWILQGARNRKGMPMSQKLAAELLEASRGQGAAVKRREDLHRMAEANRAFVHYRW